MSQRNTAYLPFKDILILKSLFDREPLHHASQPSVSIQSGQPHPVSLLGHSSYILTPPITHVAPHIIAHYKLAKCRLFMPIFYPSTESLLYPQEGSHLTDTNSGSEVVGTLDN